MSRLPDSELGKFDGQSLPIPSSLSFSSSLLLLLYLFFPPHIYFRFPPTLILLFTSFAFSSANPQIYSLSPPISVSWLLLELSLAWL
ncbi:hypothetical protein V6N13_133193 [Hibiscus sabdariffa]